LQQIVDRDLRKGGSRRMERDGWVLVQEGAFHSTRDGRRTERLEIWERRNTDGFILLRRSTDAISFRHPGGPYVEAFRLVLSSGAELPLPGAGWADWDRAGRLVFWRDGRLFAATVENGQLAERELLDLNANVPTEVEALESARQW
jgi:hypothetical protein